MFQMSQVTVEKCMEIITEFEPSPQGRQLCQLGIDGKLSTLQSCSICRVVQRMFQFVFVRTSSNLYQIW